MPNQRILDTRPLTHAERQRRSRANLRGKPVPPHIKHGSTWARKAYGCGCDVCVAVKRAEDHRRRWGWLETAYGIYDFGPEVTTIHWPPSDAGPDWTCPTCLHTGGEAAVPVGRTA